MLSGFELFRLFGGLVAGQENASITPVPRDWHRLQRIGVRTIAGCDSIRTMSREYRE
ncbi:hypothetical protein D3C72_2273630 [compost metagenome]